jgi:predicted amidophosphoribosyltransferase
MAKFQPRQIKGRWQHGYALDVHTLSSIPIGYNEFGHLQFDTTRPEVGELLFRLKNRGDTSTVDEIVAASVSYLRTWQPPIEILVPVPPSRFRITQPVMLIAKGISDLLPIPLVECITKTRDAPQLKNIFDLDERLKALDGLHAVDAAVTQGRKVLLFDDLYRSGATMNAITTTLYDQGKAAGVFVLTITRTRSFR